MLFTLTSTKKSLPVFLSFASGILCGVLLSITSWRKFDLLKNICKSNKPEYKNKNPENAPDDCPGIDSDKAAACSGCPNQAVCASGTARERDPVHDDILKNLSEVLILSGKGGVGKSTVSSQLSWLTQERGFNIGLLDVDICGPSIPMMTGTKDAEVHASADGWTPVYVKNNFAVMSIGYLLGHTDAVIWRGPKKNGLIRQFLTDVSWGALDILFIDTPPGTSDEHLSLVTYLKEAQIDGVILVTTPQEASLQDVRREINFCKKLETPVIGLIENMGNSVFDSTDIKQSAQQTCVEMQIPYLGKLPLDTVILEACESGVSVTSIKSESPGINSLNNILNRILSVIHMPSVPHITNIKSDSEQEEESYEIPDHIYS